MPAGAGNTRYLNSLPGGLDERLGGNSDRCPSVNEPRRLYRVPW